MKKLFISQPMNGKTDEEILKEREKAVESVKKQLGEDVEVIDSFFQEMPHEANPLWYLAKSLELLSAADIAYFAKGWEDARGCKIENECAIAYGIDVIEDYSASEEDFNSGAILALQGVKEEMDTILSELARKGIDEPIGFSGLKCFVDDRIADFNEILNEEE